MERVYSTIDRDQVTLVWQEAPASYAFTDLDNAMAEVSQLVRSGYLAVVYLVEDDDGNPTYIVQHEKR